MQSRRYYVRCASRFWRLFVAGMPRERCILFSGIDWVTGDKMWRQAMRHERKMKGV